MCSTDLTVIFLLCKNCRAAQGFLRFYGILFVIHVPKIRTKFADGKFFFKKKKSMRMSFLKMMVYAALLHYGICCMT